MTRDETLEHLARCAELAARSPPITDLEIQRHRQLVAAEVYRAEALRLEAQPQQQLQLVA